MKKTPPLPLHLHHPTPIFHPLFSGHFFLKEDNLFLDQEKFLCGYYPPPPPTSPSSSGSNSSSIIKREVNIFRKNHEEDWLCWKLYSFLSRFFIEGESNKYNRKVVHLIFIIAIQIIIHNQNGSKNFSWILFPFLVCLGKERFFLKPLVIFLF